MPEPGELYGKYQLLNLIAYGGMAEVWLARSSSIGGFEKFLAIKRMHSSLSQNPDFVSMFIEEAKLSVALTHPNIVQVFDFGCVDDNYFIAMEYVDGLDLWSIAHRARERNRPVPIEVATFIMQKAFEGLAYAHTPRGGRTKAVIHRDVSPQNVLVSLDGQVKISDFGIAQATENFTIAGAGQVVGKVAYMSPEQARGDALSAATDVFAAGVILHELLANRRLFASDNEEETLRAVANAHVPRPSDANQDIPAALDAIVLRALARDPELRPPTREVADALAGVLRDYYPKMNDLVLEQVLGEFRAQDGEAEPARHRTRQATAEITDNFDSENTAVGGSLVDPESTSEQTLAPRVDVDIVIEALKDQFEREPNLWLLVDIGEVYAESRDLDRARFALTLAAGKFAQRGLLVQAVSIACRLIEILDDDRFTHHAIQCLQAIGGVDDDTVLETLFGDRDEALVEEYRSLLQAARVRSASGVLPKTPILSTMSADQLTRLVYALRRREVPAGALILQEGDPGNAFYWIGRGRVVVSGHNYEGKRVYLTSLSDGDCFGEQGFFTGEPRTATVEATEPVILVEVEKSALDDLVRELPSLRAGLLEFYKERLAESLLARSPIFGQMPVRARRSLAEKFTFVLVEAGATIIHEGDESNCFYAIKAGRVEVYSNKSGESGEPVSLSVLHSGEVFGEIAALKGTLRSASVRALESTELLKLEASDLRKFLTQNKEIRERIERQMNDRLADTTRKIMISG